MWLGEQRGYAIDWFTQLWVRATGRRVRLADYPWLDAPIGATRRVGVGWLGAEPPRARCLLGSFDALASDTFDPSAVSDEVRRFYTETSAYRMDLWARWSFLAGLGARAIRAMHAEHLDQLRVPIAAALRRLAARDLRRCLFSLQTKRAAADGARCFPFAQWQLHRPASSRER